MRPGLLASILTGLATAAFAWLVSLTPAGKLLENQYALGLLYGLRGPLLAPPGAVIVALDDETIEWLRESAAEPDSHPWIVCIPPEERRSLAQLRGPSSLPRSVHACLLARLKEIGFRAVAFDILFSVPGAEQDDSLFAESLRAHGVAAILTGVERAVVRDGATELLVERKVEPLPLFQQSAAATGIFLVPKSGGPVYGYVREAPGFENTASLPDQLQALLDGQAASVPQRFGKRAFEYLWLYGPPGSVPTVSARDILSGEESDAVRALAATSAALVGASDPDTSNYPDSFPSFFQGAIGTDISGVELLATAFLNTHTNTALRRLPSAQETVVIALFAFALGFLARARSRLAMFAAPLAGLVYVGAAAFLFSRLHLFVPTATPVFIVVPTAFLIAVVVRYRFARGLIMRLAPAPAARRMLTKSTDRRSTAVTHDATVAFLDLIGSTSIAEKVPPADFNSLLNTYFDRAVENVEKHRGQIAAFTGDGITAIFTGTERRQNHAVRACLAVTDVLAAMERVNADNATLGLPALHMRIGMNSGEVVEGEIGARDRFNFSVIGDVVNLASRLEQMGKTLFPGENDVVLLGETTHEMSVGAGFPFRDCGPCEIRGRDRPERVFRLELPHRG